MGVPGSRPQPPPPNHSSSQGVGTLPPPSPLSRRPAPAPGWPWFPAKTRLELAFVTLGKSLPPVSLSFLPGRTDSSRGPALPTPQEGAAQRVRKRFVRRSAPQRCGARGGSRAGQSCGGQSSSLSTGPLPRADPRPSPPGPPRPAGGPRTCSGRSAAGAATLRPGPKRPVARRAKAAGGGRLGPGRRRWWRGARAARGPELGGARPGRRRPRLEVRGGGSS